MKIEEVAKTMTRQEFLNELKFTENGENVIGGKILGESIICPTNYNINISKYYCDRHKCKDCWENAIKNIKFKDEFNNDNENKKKDKDDKEEIGNMSFDWQGFMDGKFAVHCDAEEKALEFLERCSEQNLSWESNYWEYAKEDTCYYCINKKIYYASIKLFENSGKEILEWEI